MADIPPFVYVTYVRSTPERVWHALTDADSTCEWWGYRNVSDWQVGSTWEHRRADGSDVVAGVGTVLERQEPERLKLTFPTDASTELTFEIEPHREIVRLTVTHGNLSSQHAYNMVADMWFAVLANLKSLIETGYALAEAPMEMLWALDT